MVLTSLAAQPGGYGHGFQRQVAWAQISAICQQQEFEALFTFSMLEPFPTWKAGS